MNRKHGGSQTAVVFIFIPLHQIVAFPQKLETAAGFELRVNEKVPSVELPACLQANSSVEANISFVRHMFFRRDPSKSCSINFTVCFTDLPFHPCVIVLIESRF